MPVIGGAAAGSIGSSVITGMMAAKANKEAMAQAQAALNAAADEIRRVGASPDLSAEIVREKFKQVGLLTPEIENFIDIGVSKESQIQEDKNLRDAQTGALELLQKTSREGVTADDRAVLNKIRRQIQGDVRGKEQQLMQEMQARGQGGSGAELAARLIAQQSGADIASEEGDRIAAQSRQQALQAIAGSGQLGGQIRAQDFSVNQARASAADQFQRFNTEQQVAQQQRNVGARNVAAAQNLSEQQRIADTNTAQTNEERLRQAEARRQKWLDDLNQAQAIASIRAGVAPMAIQSGQQKASIYQGIGQGISQASTALGSLYGGKKDTTSTTKT